MFLGFFTFYLLAAQTLRTTPVFDRLDVFFESDSRRVWKDMVGERLGNHSHSSGHPNFVILHQPVGWSLSRLLKEWGLEVKKAEADKTAAQLMTSAGAAGVVVLFYQLLLTHPLPRHRAVLFSCVLGFSTVQMVYCAIPETYIFSALGLTAAAWLAARRRVGGVWWHVAAVYAWSALTTNIVQLGILAMAGQGCGPWRVWVRRGALTIGVSTALMIALNLAQTLIYPKSDLFFLPQSIARQTHWVAWDRLLAPVDHIRILLQHQWLTNVIAPEPVKIMNAFRPTWPTASVEAGTWDMFAPAWPLFAAWCVVLAGAAAGLFTRRSMHSPLILASLAILAFYSCFFLVFGHDRFLYSALWTPTSVFLIAIGWELHLERRPAFAKALVVLMAVLITGQAWHNWHFLMKIARLVS